MKNALMNFAAILLISLMSFGCGDSSRNKSSGPPIPEPAMHNQLVNYGSAQAPVTSDVPFSVTVWMRQEIIGYNPHPSVRLTKSVLRPGKFNTPLERVLEEVVLTRPLPDSRISPNVVGPPAGWTVVFMSDRITLSVKEVDTVDIDGNKVRATQIDKQANGLVDFKRRVIWVLAFDDAVTPEGSPLAPAYSHELLHAHLYEEALKRGLTQTQAEREGASID